MTRPEATKLTAFWRYAPPTSHIRTHKVAKEQRIPHTKWLANSPMAAGSAIPKAARKPSPHSISVAVVSECRAIKARQARRHLEPEITPMLFISDLETTDFTDYSDFHHPPEIHCRLSRSKKLDHPFVRTNSCEVNQAYLWVQSL